MNIFYLDHNIYIRSLNDISIVDAIATVKNNEQHFVYSPAHIEEIYKAQYDGGDKYTPTRILLMDKIKLFTDNLEFIPSVNGIVTRVENPEDCYNRVAEYDTRKIISIQSTERFNIDNNFYKNLIYKDKHNVSISSLPPEKIWMHPLISKEITNLNTYMPNFIEEYNNSDFILSLLKMCNIDKRLPNDLQFLPANYHMLKDSFTQLEFIIEILFRVLSTYGYYADKNEKTSLSGTHDVSHAIYATKANKFFTTDRRFAKRCAAVYFFLKVNTEVIVCESNDIAIQLLKHI